MPGSIRAVRHRVDPIRGRGRIPLSKARSAGRPQFRDAGSDTLSRQEEAIADAIRAAYDLIPPESLLNAVETADTAGYARTVLTALTEAAEDLQDVLLESFVASGETSALDLGRELSRQYTRVGKADAPSPSDVALRFRFNATDPRATAWAQTEAGRLITNMAASEQAMFRQLVEQSFVESRTVQTTASSIFQQLQTVTPSPGARDFAEALGGNLNGLTTRYEQAVMNRVANVADDLAKRGITGTKALDRMRKEGDKYATKLRRTRSRTIARTERMMAHNQARLLSYQQAIDAGIMSREHSRKVWSTGPFDVCPICVGMAGTEAKVADPFTLPNGAQVQAPPAHPNCRCTLSTRTDTDLYQPPQALGTGVPGDPFRLSGQQLTPGGRIATQVRLPGVPVPPVPTPPPPTPPAPAATPPPPAPPVLEPPPVRAPRSLGPGPKGGRTFRDTVELPEAQRGELLQRRKSIEDLLGKLDTIHGLPEDDVARTVLRFGGKNSGKGGHFTPGTRGPKPRRARGMSFDEWKAKVDEYNARALNPEIMIAKTSDEFIGQGMSDMIHELGHRVDWDGKNFVSRKAWRSDETRVLLGKYRSEWMDHLDEIVDQDVRDFAELGRIVRDADSVKKYLKGATSAHRQYYTDIAEVWARSYNQYIAEIIADPRVTTYMNRMKEIGYQFSDEEFEAVREIVERILRRRGLMRELDDVARLPDVTPPTAPPKPPSPPSAPRATAGPSTADDVTDALTQAGFGRYQIAVPDDAAALWQRTVASGDEMDFARGKLRWAKSDEVQRWKDSIVASADDLSPEQAKALADVIVSQFVSDAQKAWEYSRGLEFDEVIKFFRANGRLKGVSDAEARRILRESREQFADFMGEAKVSVQISPSNLEKVLDDGRLKSQFETDTSGGIKDIARRQRNEAQTFGIRFDEDVVNRPIYGHIELPGRANSMTDHYGSARLILKDEVRDRATYVSEDSLTTVVRAEPVNRPRLDTAQFDLDGWPPSHGRGFVETQVFGGVRVDDIAEVVFDVSTSGYKAPTAELLKRLDDANIPYRFVRRAEQGTSQTKFDLIDMPNPLGKGFERPVLNEATVSFDEFVSQGRELAERFVAEHGYSWDIARGNPSFVEMAKRNGFNAKPLKVSDAEWEQVLADGWTPIYRGLNGDSAEDVASYVAQFIDADTPFGGSGMFGSGHYVTDVRSTAEAYAREAHGIGQAKGARAAGEVMDLALHPEAKIVDLDDLHKEMTAFIEERRAFDSQNLRRTATNEFGEVFEQSVPLEELAPEIREQAENLNAMYQLIEEDPGRFALARGYDAVKIRNPQVSYDQPELPDTFFAILNRGALAVRRSDL